MAYGRIDSDGIKRDWLGRPLIPRTEDGKEVPYTRVSTMAKALSDSTALTKWKMRQVMLGLVQRPDLALLVSSHHDDKKELDRVAAAAMEAVSSSSGANTGTGIHKLIERLEAGEQIALPEQVQQTIGAYGMAMQDANVKVLANEQFVVVDELQAAGTFDKLLQLPDGSIVIADIKTGSSTPSYPLETAIQMAIYSRGIVFDSKSKERTSVLRQLGVSQDIGVMIHLPQGEANCTLYRMNLDLGWEAAQLAHKARWLNKSATKKELITKGIE